MLILDVLLYLFIAVVCIQVIFYFLFLFQFSLVKPTISKPKSIAVSVIVCAKNEAENLKTFLPSIIEQDYPNFEIVLINDDSHDDTLEVMEDFALKHSNIKLVKVKNIEAFWASKKYALTLGIKAAKNDYLLFTDADCRPVSKNWIRSMSAHFSNEKTFVFGYGAYEKKKGSFLNKLIRFETILTAIQYFSYTKMGMPYMAVGRNLAYRKDEFFKVNGFMSHMHVRSGDDDLFVNEAASKLNTALCFTADSFTVSNPKETFKQWISQKRRHVSTASFYKPLHKTVLGLFYSSQLLFWALATTLLLFLFQWKLVLLLVGFRFLLQGFVFYFASKKLKDKDVFYFFPILEFFLIISQLHIFIVNLFSKPVHWK